MEPNQKNSRDYGIGTIFELWSDPFPPGEVTEKNIDCFVSYKDQHGITQYGIKANSKIVKVIDSKVYNPGDGECEKVIAKSEDGLYFICSNVRYCASNFQWCCKENLDDESSIGTYLHAYEAYNQRLLILHEDGTMAKPKEPYYVRQDTGIAWHRNDTEKMHCYSNTIDYRKKQNPGYRLP